MEGRVGILILQKNNLTEGIAYGLTQEQIEYEIVETKKAVEVKEFDWLVVINNFDIGPVLEAGAKNKVKILIVSPNKVDLKNINSYHCTVITKLVEDKKTYSPTQKEYLFRKGLYSVVNKYIHQYLEGADHLASGTIVDLREVNSEPTDWIFEFSSLNESYSWLMERNSKQDPKAELKIINFFLDRLYNDSDKEIRYLVERISKIKNGQKSSDIFICTKEELAKYSKNLFFKNLIKNISKNYKTYLVDKDRLKQEYPDIYDAVIWGIIIYDDCVYRDYFDNKISLGYVDCREEKVKEYNQIYETMINNLGVEIKGEEDLNGF